MNAASSERGTICWDPSCSLVHTTGQRVHFQLATLAVWLQLKDASTSIKTLQISASLVTPSSHFTTSASQVRSGSSTWSLGIKMFKGSLVLLAVLAAVLATTSAYTSSFSSSASTTASPDKSYDSDRKGWSLGGSESDPSFPSL